MRTLLLILSQAILLTLLAFWYQKNPGTFEMQWLGYHIQGNLGLLLFGALIGGMLLLLLLRFLGGIFHLPSLVRKRYAHYNQQRGLNALEDSLVAYIAKDAKLLKKTSDFVGRFLKDSPLTSFFQAHAALLAQDDSTAQAFFTTLSQSPSLGFLGHQGLLDIALKENHLDQAIDHATACLALHKNAVAIRRLRLDLYLQKECYTQALDDVAQLSKATPICPGLLEQKKTALYHIARQKHQEHQHTLAVSYLEEALKIAPADLDLLTLYGAVLRHLGSEKALLKALEKAWSKAPRREFLDMALSLKPNATELDRFKIVQKFIQHNPTHPESHLALARQAIGAQLWGAAHDTLKTLMIQQPHPPEVYDLLKQLEKGEGH